MIRLLRALGNTVALWTAPVIWRFRGPEQRRLDEKAAEHAALSRLRVGTVALLVARPATGVLCYAVGLLRSSTTQE